jgi:hypothetical protein
VGPLPADAGQPRTCTLDSILSEVHTWEADQQANGPAIGEIKSRVVRELAPYLGVRAADRILERVSGEGDDLLARIESALALFLGERAAEELTGHIVDAAIVRP